MLSYHVIPSGAVLSSQLTDGQEVPTALAGADPLTVNLNDGNVEFEGANGSSATVTVPDIRAGRSVIHVIDDVLLPAGVAQNGTANGTASPMAADPPATANGTASPVAADTPVPAAGAATPAGTAAPSPASPTTSAAGASKPAASMASGIVVLMLMILLA